MNLMTWVTPPSNPLPVRPPPNVCLILTSELTESNRMETSILSLPENTIYGTVSGGVYLTRPDVIPVLTPSRLVCCGLMRFGGRDVLVVYSEGRRHMRGKSPSPNLVVYLK